MRPRELQTLATGGAFRIEVRSEHHSWNLDESVERGGTDAGPTPVEAFLGALLSCLTISFEYSAKRHKIPIDRIEGWIAANEERYVEEIAIELQVWSDAPESEVQAILPSAERGCFVKATLKPEISCVVDLVVHPATPAPPAT